LDGDTLQAVENPCAARLQADQDHSGYYRDPKTWCDLECAAIEEEERHLYEEL
jgi:hypothetical protein